MYYTIIKAYCYYENVHGQTAKESKREFFDHIKAVFS